MRSYSTPDLTGSSTIARMPPRLTLRVQPWVSKSGPRSVTLSVASRRAPPVPRRWAWTSVDGVGLLRLTITIISWPALEPTVTQRAVQALPAAMSTSAHYDFLPYMWPAARCTSHASESYLGPRPSPRGGSPRARCPVPDARARPTDTPVLRPPAEARDLERLLDDSRSDRVRSPCRSRVRERGLS
jgi:hypothetical protein